MKGFIMLVVIVLLVVVTVTLPNVTNRFSVHANVIKKESEVFKRNGKVPHESNLSVDMNVQYTGAIIDPPAAEGSDQGDGSLPDGDAVQVNPMPKTSDNTLFLSELCLVLLGGATGLMFIGKGSRRIVS